MKKYMDVCLNQYGDPIQGVSCTVLQYPSNAVANIFSDNGITQTTNPVTTDSQGMFSFYTGNGRYSITFTGSGVTKDSLIDVLIDDPAEAQAYNITGGSVNATPIGATTPSTGVFTTLTASTLNLGAFNGPIGNVTPNVATFTTVTATDLNVSNVANITVTTAQTALSASTLLGSTWAAPGTIGSSTPSSGAFTTLTSSGTSQFGATQATSINNTPIGATTPSTGSFTTLAVSGGINNIPVGATTAATGRFTTLVATSGINSTNIGVTTPGIGGFTAFSSATPIAKVAAFTVGAAETSFTVTGTGSVPVTLPAAASFPGRWVYITNRAAFTIVSAASNVIPRAGGAAGTAICSGTAGTWAALQSNGTNWEIMAGA
jgi:hypothetical protein